jgi:hypothetical protein
VGYSAGLNEVEKEDVVRGFNPPYRAKRQHGVSFAANFGQSTGSCLTFSHPQKHDSQQHQSTPTSLGVELPSFKTYTLSRKAVIASSPRTTT